MMRMSHFIFVVCLSICLSPPVLAQQDDVSQGYIFDQPYVKRISPAQADSMLGRVNALEIDKNGNWPREHVDGTTVLRKGRSLTMTFAEKPPLVLQDHVDSGHDNGDADSQQFTYIRRQGRYHVIGVTFAHDSPGFLLVDPTSAQVFFVHPE